MVTTRTGQTFATLQRSVFTQIINRFGRKDITLTSQTETVNSEGRVTAVSEVTSTIEGDLQFVTFQDKQYLDRGVAKVGDGLFYCIYSTTLLEGDTVTVDGVRWELVSMVENETIDTSRVYQAWITRRRS